MFNRSLKVVCDVNVVCVIQHKQAAPFISTQNYEQTVMICHNNLNVNSKDFQTKHTHKKKSFLIHLDDLGT